MHCGLAFMVEVGCPCAEYVVLRVSELLDLRVSKLIIDGCSGGEGGEGAIVIVAFGCVLWHAKIRIALTSLDPCCSNNWAFLDGMLDEKVMCIVAEGLD